MTLHFSFTCQLCGNKEGDEFYAMPIDEKTPSGDTVHSTSVYRLTCKRCGKNHFLTLRITI